MPFETMDAVFEDNVKPNKKYYYMFRSLNEMGMVSNPTIVFEVELLVDADDSKVVVERYYFKEPRKEEPNRGFRKLFRIKSAA